MQQGGKMNPVLLIVFGITLRLTYCQVQQKLPTAGDRHISRQLTKNISDERHKLFVQHALLYCPGTDMCFHEYSRNVSFPGDTFECCGPCECDKECYRKETCCPTLYLEKNETSLPSNSTLLEYKSEMISDDINCLFPEVLPHHTSEAVPNSWESFLMVWKCPDNYKYQKISLMCKEAGKSRNPDMDIRLVIPVTSLRTNITYRNIYCGQCHGESEKDLVKWEGKLFCPLLSKFAAQSFQDMLRKIIIEEKCNLLFDPVTMVKDIQKMCWWGTFTECNITGKWDVYDPLIEDGCHGFTLPYLHHYRNVFCFMCNEKEEPWMRCTPGDMKFYWASARHDSFSGYINFNNAESFWSANASRSNDLTNSENCPPGTRYDYFKDKCRDITCSANLVYNGSHCRNMFDRVSSQMYDLHIQFTPEHPDLFINCEMCVLSAINAMFDYVSKFLIEAGHPKSNWCGIQMFYKPVNGLPLLSDALVNVSQILIRVVVRVPGYHDYNTIISNLSKIQSEKILLNVNTSHIDISAGFEARLIYGDSGYADEDYSLPLLEDEKQIQTFYDHRRLSEIKFNVEQCFRSLRTTQVTNFKTCPRITINSNEFTIVETTQRTCITEISLCLKSGQHLKLTDGSMEICAELYFGSIEKLKKNKFSDDVNDFIVTDAPLVPDVLSNTLNNAQYLSLYCTTLSLVAVIITFFGFIRTKKVQNLTGKINVVLLIMFGLAQMLQELSFLTNRLKVLCETAGVLAHFVWIATAFWINAACFNISKIFLVKSKLFQGISEIKHLLIFLAYTVVLSSLFVVSCILINFLVSNGGHIGYGGSWCFIISNNLFLYTYTLPIILTALVNVFIVINVVVKYGTHVDTKLKLAFHYRMLKRYVLLSLVFALTAALRTSYKWTSLMPILYTTIALNATQGILLCLLLFCIKSNHKGSSSQSYYLDKFQNESNATTAENKGETLGERRNLNSCDETNIATKTAQNNVKALCYDSNRSSPHSSNGSAHQTSNGSTPRTPQYDQQKRKLQSPGVNDDFDCKQIEERITPDDESRRNEISADTSNIASALDHSDVTLSEDGCLSSRM